MTQCNLLRNIKKENSLGSTISISPNLMNFLIVLPLMYSISMTYIIPIGQSLTEKLLWISFIIAMLFRRNKLSLDFKIVRPLVIACIVLLLTTLILNIVIHKDPIFWPQVRSIFDVLLFCFVFQHWKYSQQIFHWISLISGLLFSMFLIYAIPHSDNPNFYFIGRLGIYMNPGLFANGMYVIMIVSLFSGISLFSSASKYAIFLRWGQSLVVFAAVIAIFISSVRGVMIAIPIPFLFVLLYLYRKKILFTRKVLLYLTTLFLGILSIGIYNTSILKERIQLVNKEISMYASDSSSQKSDSLNQKKTSIGARLVAWDTAFKLYKYSPVIGVSMHEKRKIVEQLAKEGKADPAYLDIREIKDHAHGEIFNRMQYQGTLGLISLLIFYFVPFILFLKDIVNYNQWLSYLGISLILGYIVIALTNTPFVQYLTMYHYILLSLFCLIELDRTQKINRYL